MQCYERTVSASFLFKILNVLAAIRKIPLPLNCTMATF